MPSLATTAPAWPDRPAEVEHVNEIIRALMERAERAAHVQGSGASGTSSPIVPDDAERRRAAELDLVLGENETFIRTLNESEAKFRGLVSQSLIGTAIVEDGKFSYSNAKFDEIFGYSADEIRAMSPLALSAKSFHPVFTEVFGKHLSGAVQRIERVAHGLRKNGDEIDVDLHSSAVEFGGKRALIAMVMDVTERIRAEREVLALQARLLDQSTHDPLTGLYNRRYLEEALDRELILAARHGRPVSLIMGDLDHFKGVNDRYGHLAGDEVLRAFGALLKRNARGTDIYCRYGGEEFLLVLPEMAQDSAAERARQLCSAVAAASVPYGAASITVTASFGVATFPRDGSTGDALIAAADRAMYSAKTTGRNRVTVSSGPMGQELEPAAFAGNEGESGTAALPSAYDRLKTAMEGAWTGAWEADLRTRKMIWDTTLRRQYGLGASEPDPDLAQWLALLHTDDRAAARAKVEACLSLGAGRFDAEFRVRLADGSVRWFRSFGQVFHGRDGVALRASGINLDITEIKDAQAEKDKAVRELELFRALLDQANDAIEVVDPQTLKFLDVNTKACTDLGYSREELLAMRATDIDLEMDRCYFGGAEKDLRESGSALFDTVHRRKDGSTFPVEVNIRRVTLGRDYNIVVARDITARNRSRHALRDSESRFRSLIETTSDVIAIAGRDGKITYVSPAVRQVLGYEPEELIGRNYFDLIVPEEMTTARANMAELVRRSGEPLRAVRRIRHKDGSVRELESVGRDLSDLPGIAGVVVSMRDVTARQAAETGLRLANLVLEQSPSVLFRWTTAAGGPVVYASENVRQWGYEAEAFVAGKRPFIDIVHPDDLGRVMREVDSHLAAGATNFALEYRIVTPSGSAIWVDARISVERDVAGNPLFFQGVITDINDRKAQQRALARVNRALKALSAGSSAVVHAQSESTLLQRMCGAVVDDAGYRMAWVGFAEADAARTIRGVAWAGQPSDYVASAKISWADADGGHGPAGRCVRTGEPQVARNIAADPSMSRWWDEAVRYGYQSALALPLVGPSGVVGTLMIFAGEPDAFDADELALLSQMAGELSYGIAALHTYVANADNLRRVERGMESMVRALASVVEVRDPYTAGHQRRVAGLATEIGRLLGLSDDRLRGLRVGAAIHDIGKVTVPAEILSKPGSLSAAEFELIKAHPAAGAGILDGVEFPWPVAEMIHQHHERLDGSGYPRGLKGEQILLEARIIAVADVVEAMSSHRPFRPGKGLDAALAEISRGRGVAFDADVVDACTKLFRERGYRIPD